MISAIAARGAAGYLYASGRLRGGKRMTKDEAKPYKPPSRPPPMRAPIDRIPDEDLVPKKVPVVTYKRRKI